MKKIRLTQALPFIFQSGDDDMGVSMFLLRDPITKDFSYVLAAGYQENYGPLSTAVFGRLVDLSATYKTAREFFDAMAEGYLVPDDFLIRPAVRHVMNSLADAHYIEITPA